MRARVKLYSMLIVFITMLMPQILYAHGSFEEHKNDMYRVLGFQRHPQITEWMKFISSEMIDKLDYHYKLSELHPGFTCKGPNLHRLLFHWGYNAEPWNTSLELRVREYARKVSLNEDSLVKVFKTEIKEEQKQRNKEMNRMTENLFGFSSRGRDAARANFFVAIVYDVHLLGDYTEDNTNFDGLASFDRIVKDIVDRITILNPSDTKGKAIVANLHRIERNSRLLRAEKAQLVIDYLSKTLPDFIMTVEEGSIYRRLQKKGFFILLPEKEENNILISMWHSIVKFF